MAFVIATTNSSVASTVAPGQVSLRLAVEQQVARFANGGGYGDNGGFFPRRNASALDWIWTTGSASPRGVPKLGTGWRLWLGDVDAGLWLKLKGASRDWNRAGGGELPVESWARDAARGGLRVASNTSTAGSGGVTTVEAYAQLGAAALASAGTAGVTFNFSLMATPVKGDWQHTAQGRHEHYVDARHYHVPYGQWEPPDPAALRAEMGINVYILHQSNRLNPYIDYPFHPSVEPSLAALVRSASQHGVRTKLYYTVGQLSNHAIELFALASLNGEILLRNASDTPPGPGPASAATATQRGQLRGMGGDLMGNEWLEEHLVEGYQGGWFTMNPGGDEDASIADDTTSRILNYYIEGQQYLFSKVGIAGLYYDGFGAERFVQQRIRRMTTAAGAAKPNTSAAAVFDVHGRAFQNTELLPYVDSMWTCEGIDFTRDAAYWLVSISALPFGTYGEMLGADKTSPVPGCSCGESCANKWRGMLFGMTNRAGWNGRDPNDNAGLWALWDAFGIERADMYGWWNASTPVTVLPSNSSVGAPVFLTSRDEQQRAVLATAYVRRDTGAASAKVLIALASWSPDVENVSLQINFTALGLDPASASLTAPALPSFNRANATISMDVSAPLPVPAWQGWLLLLRDSDPVSQSASDSVTQ